MEGVDPNAALMMLIALAISVGNLIVAFGRTRVKQAETDTQAMEMVLRLAERTPELEKQLRETMVILTSAQAELVLNREKISEMDEIIQQRTEEIRRLQAENRQLAATLATLRSSVQTLEAAQSA
jgi:hypothetical protein